MPKLVHVEDALGDLVHRVFQNLLTREEAERVIALPDGVLWKDFWNEYAKLMHRYEDYSHCRIIGQVTRGLMKKFWEPPKEEAHAAA